MEKQEELELEIAAFMGPHIKRARIALVLIGLLYAYLAYKSYGDVSQAHDEMKRFSASDPRMSEYEHAVNLIYYLTVFVGVAGVANIVLAVIAGRTPTTSMYAAMAIFVALSCFELYVSGVLLFTSWLWWLSAIVLGLGFQAAHKAAKLRRERQPA